MKLLMSFSGGRSSALALRILTINGVPENMRILFANTGKERQETLDFVHECEIRWKLPIVWIEATFSHYDLSKETMISSIGYKKVNYQSASRNGEPFAEMIDWINCGIVPNRVSRFCTKYLKIVPMDRYMEQYGSYQKIMGIRHDEPERIVKHPDVIMPLNENKISHRMVREFWSKQPFDLQLRDYEGNCDLCHLKSRRKRLTILKENPEKAKWWIDQERKTNSEFERGWPVEKLLKRAIEGKFYPVVDQLIVDQNNPQLFGDDLQLNCFCGD